MRSTIHSLTIVALILLSAGFLSTATGGWLIANWDGTGGANIGAGGLMLLGTGVGFLGLILAIVAGVLSIVRGSRSRSRGRR